MRKLKRCVDQNKRKQARARRALMAMMATTVVLSDAGSIVAYAQEIPGELQTDEGDNAGTPEEGNGDASNGTGDEGGNNGENGNSGDGETGNSGDGETGNNGDGEDGNNDDGEDEETGEEEDGEDKEDEETSGALLRAPRMMLASASPANTTETNRPEPGSTTDISNCTISDGKIKVIIGQNGSYTFTGTNEIHNAYVDVSILIESGVTADLYFDNFNIVNDDFDCSETSTVFSAEGLVVNPIVVQGTANVHVKGNSEIKAVSDLFAVSGTLNFVDSESNAKLDCALSKINKAQSFLVYPQMISQSGEVHFKDANVCFTNQDLDGNSYTTYGFTFAEESVKVCLDGTGLSLDNIQPGKMYTSLTGTNLSGLSFSVGELYDMKGSRIYYLPFSGFPKGSQILQIDFMEGESSDGRVLEIKQPTDLFVDSNGSIPNMIVKGDCIYFYIRNGENIEGYVSYLDDLSGRAYNVYRSSQIVSVKFLDSDSGNAELLSYYSLKAWSDDYSNEHGNNLIFPEEDSQYLYTYKLQDGTIVSKDTQITGDMVIYVSKAEKGKVTITLDGNSYTVDYGVTLSSVNDWDGYYLNMDSKELVKGDVVITESCSFKTVSIPTTTEDGKEWFLLNSAEDMEQFAQIVNCGNGNINGRLTTDVRLNSNFPMIGTIGEFNTFTSPSEVNDNSYCGTFDGQNNTVTVDFHKDDYATGLFGCISTGAMIQNIILDGKIEGGRYTGGIVGLTFSKGGSVTIKKCINQANVLATGEGSFAGGLIGGSLYVWDVDAGNMKVNISYCGNAGEISSKSGNNGGMVGYGHNADIFSCYNADGSNFAGFGETVKITGSYSRAGSEDVVKSAEAFRSGEVTYLMNKASGNNMWFQTCGIGKPSLSGSIVYAGYANCYDTELSYANEPFSHTTPGHKDKEEYTYENGKVSAGCEYCTDLLYADIDCKAEELSDHLKGVTVKYNEDWLNCNFHNIIVMYSAEEDGDYVTQIPQNVGEYYVRLVFEGSNRTIDIADMYTIKARPKQENTSDSNENHEPESEKSIVVPVTEKKETEIAQKANTLVSTRPNNGANSRRENVKKTTSTNEPSDVKDSKKVTQTYKYTGSTISRKLLNVLKKDRNAVIRYEGIYKGKKYVFLITYEDLKYFDKSMQSFEPAYLYSYFALKEKKRLSRVSQIKDSIRLFR